MFSSWLGISNSHLIYLTKENSSIPVVESFFQKRADQQERESVSENLTDSRAFARTKIGGDNFSPSQKIFFAPVRATKKAG